MGIRPDTDIDPEFACCSSFVMILLWQLHVGCKSVMISAGNEYFLRKVNDLKDLGWTGLDRGELILRYRATVGKEVGASLQWGEFTLNQTSYSALSFVKEAAFLCQNCSYSHIFPSVLSPRSSRLHKEGSLESIKEFAILRRVGQRGIVWARGKVYKKKEAHKETGQQSAKLCW